MLIWDRHLMMASYKARPTNSRGFTAVIITTQFKLGRLAPGSSSSTLPQHLKRSHWHGYHVLTHLSGFTAQAMHQLASYLPASLSDLLAQNVYISHRITSSWLRVVFWFWATNNLAMMAITTLHWRYLSTTWTTERKFSFNIAMLRTEMTSYYIFENDILHCWKEKVWIV